jgi:type II secretory pathway pseudopilin PulG
VIVTGDGRGAPSGRTREQGFTLVEVLVAGVIMIMVLVPSAMLLSSSARVLSVTQAKIVAANLATGVLDEDRALAGSGTWAGTPPVPGLPAPTSPTTVNGVLFSVSQSGGWCALGSGALGDYASAPAAPPAYGVLVTVTWLSGAHSVTAGETLTTPVTVVAAGVGNNGGAPSVGAACPL